MKEIIMKIKLNTIKLQNHMKEQEKQTKIILNKLEQMEPKRKEIIIQGK